jgi:putative mRNA 3-end processing factor
VYYLSYSLKYNFLNLIQFTSNGLYCPIGDFYIDPWKPVKKAIITHAHSDHARWGSDAYLCTEQSLPLLKLRLGDINVESLEWRKVLDINGVSVSFYPAGHIIGSAQVRVSYKGEIWVFTGDYKLEDDGISTPYEPVKCHSFITESTFGLPIYKWKPQQQIFDDMKNWIAINHAEKVTSVLIAYSLGKAQRILQPLAETGLKIYGHGAIWNVHETLLASGWDLPPIIRITPETPREEIKGNIVIAPPGADGTPWMRKLSPHATGICSGWMQVRGNVRRRNADAAFALSDHADWDGLKTAVEQTGASRVFTTHGFQSAFSRYLNEKGIESHEVSTAFGNEEEEEVLATGNDENPAAT